MDEMAIRQLISDVRKAIQAGCSNAEIVEYLDTYTANKADLVQVIRVLMKEKGDL